MLSTIIFVCLKTSLCQMLPVAECCLFGVYRAPKTLNQRRKQHSTLSHASNCEDNQRIFSFNIPRKSLQDWLIQIFYIYNPGKIMWTVSFLKTASHLPGTDLHCDNSPSLSSPPSFSMLLNVANLLLTLPTKRFRDIQH